MRSVDALVLAGLALVWPVLSAVSAADEQPRPADIFAAARAAVAGGQTEKTRLLGFGIEKDFFTDLPARGALLVGFDVALVPHGKDSELVTGLRPVYRTSSGITYGRDRGMFNLPVGTKGKEKPPRFVEVRAKAGYAVGGLTVRSGLKMHGLSLTFLRINGSSLDPEQSYVSKWVGSRVGGGDSSVSTGGAPVVGVFGNLEDGRVLAVGLIRLKPPAVVAKAPSPVKPPAPVEPRVETPPRPPAVPAAPRVEKPDPPERAPQPRPEGPGLEAFIPQPKAYRDSRFHYELEIPAGWKEMSSAELARIHDLIRQRMPNSGVRYETGFRPSGAAPGTFPYVLVQHQKVPTQGLSYEEIERTLALGVKSPLEEAKGAFSDVVRDVAPGKPVLDRASNRVVLRMNVSTAGWLRVQSLHVCHIGAKGVVSIHSYAEEGAFAKHEPTFTRINDSFAFEKGHTFTPAPAPAALASSSVSWLPVAVFTAVSGALLVPLLIVFGRRRAAAAARKQAQELPQKKAPELPQKKPASEKPQKKGPAKKGQKDIDEPLPASRELAPEAGPAPSTQTAPALKTASSAICTSPPAGKSGWEVPAVHKPALPPHFQVVSQFAVRANHKFRIYVLPEELLFLEAGLADKGEEKGDALANLFEGLLGAAEQKRSAREIILDKVDGAELQELVDEGGLNFRGALADLTEVRLEVTSSWESALGSSPGHLRVRHRDLGEYAFVFTASEEARKAKELLSGVLGEVLLVNGGA